MRVWIEGAGTVCLVRPPGDRVDVVRKDGPAPILITLGSVGSGDLGVILDGRRCDDVDIADEEQGFVRALVEAKDGHRQFDLFTLQPFVNYSFGKVEVVLSQKLADRFIRQGVPPAWIRQPVQKFDRRAAIDFANRVNRQRQTAA